LVTFNDNYSDSFDEVKSDSKGKWSNSTSYNHKKLGQEWNITPQKDGYTFEPSALHEGWEKSDPSTWIVKKNANNINFTGIYDEPNHSPVIFELTADPPSVDINQTTTITCTASDPDDDDALTYTWTKTGGTFEGSITGPTITWRAPSTSDTYTVVCGVSDGNGGEATKSVGIPVSNITPTNQAPHIPNNPSPTDNSLGVLVNTDLGWTGGDPDPEDTVTYDVYFEANDSTPDVLVSNDQSNITYNPGILNYNTHYYWKIIAKDNHSQEVSGSIWDFTAEDQSNILSFTSLTPATVSTSDSTHIESFSAMGKNFNNVDQITVSWSGPDSGSQVWNKGDSKWNAAVTVNSDTWMTLLIKVLSNETGTQTKTWTWTVTLKDNTGATASKSFTVIYTPLTPQVTGVDPSQPTANPYRQYIDILGNNFDSNAQVTLQISSSIYSIPDDRTYFINSTKIKIYVGLTDVGNWKVWVTNPDSQKSNEYVFYVKP